MAIPVQTRRKILKGAALAAAGLAFPTLIGSRSAVAAGTQKVNMQLGWIVGGNQIGEVVAKRLGYFEEEKIDFAIQPGGPSIDGVAIVASGRYEVGQVSSSPSLMLAASQAIPVTCFAIGAQKHPYCFFSLPKSPIRTAEDMIGKKIGVQATGQILLTALLRKHNIPADKIEKVIVGSDMTPLVSGQVDAITGWRTNTTALKALGPDYVSMSLWDQGVRLYALPYYATTDTLQSKAELLAGFLRAAGRGWAYAKENQEKAVDLLVKEYPNLVAADELVAEPIMLSYEFTDRTKTFGWGSFDTAVWQEQIDLQDELKQFTAGKPKLDQVMTMAILDATKDARPKIG
ncbi:MAG TPA: ABC transporter substrate-binding protein [Roseiarcus sp.]|jgi:NitT/TauT family transport system substrate-binding protein|nr:ABC transporter substrate-binding protein [Roseiarcus sp.]